MNAITLNMTATTAGATSQGSNSEGRLDKIKAKMGLLGKAEAVGAGSRRDAGLALTEAAYAGDIDEDDAETCYDAYQVEYGKLAAKKHLAGAGDNAKSRTAQISKFRAFIKVGMLPEPVDGREILARAVAIAEQVTAGGNKVLSPFEALRTVCVAQVAQPDAPLTDEQISAAVSKPEPADKDEMAKLVAAYKAAHKLAETIALPGTQAAVQAYADAIVELGGEVPAMTKEEKEMAAFMAKAATLGFKVQ
jgi:hypothetical protein